MTLTFLGTGTSTGVPTLGCSCPVCRSSDPKNKRSRSSAWIQDGDFSILIDAGPDLRSQLLREGLGRPDTVLITHSHADHILGLDDLRPLSYLRPIPVYGDEKTLSSLKVFFPYMFTKGPSESSRPDLNFLHVEDSFILGPWAVQRIPIYHGKAVITAYRIGDLAYVTDCSLIPEESYELLKGVTTLVLGALRYESHPTHFSLDQALLATKRIGARRTYFTHLGHSMDHGPLLRDLPPGIEPAWDGLKIEL